MQNTIRQLAGDFHLAFPCDFGGIPELDRVKTTTGLVTRLIPEMLT